MGDAIKHCFANIANFKGRDNRLTFWWWVLLVVIITFGLSFISGIVFAASAITGGVSSMGSEASANEIEAQVLQSMASSMPTQLWFGVVTSLIGLGLIIAAFVRRLRDAGLPVLIAIIPVLTTLWSIYVSLTLGSQVADLMAAGDIAGIEDLQQTSIVFSFIGYLGYLIVFIGGVFPSKN